MLRALQPDGGPVLVETVAAEDLPLRSALRSGQFRRLTPGESLRLSRPPSLSGRSRRNLSGALRRVPGGGYSGPLGRCIYREEAEGVFDPGVASVQGNVLYSGFFQNEGYFTDRSSVIVDSMVPVSGAASDHLRRVAALGADESVAVVVRAGLDYVRLGWTVPLEWYLAAVEQVLLTVPNPSFVVFSDVPFAADALASLLRPYGPAHAVIELEPVQQLQVMAHADHLVTAATSFGWWGAWLGDALRGFDDRVVVVPDPWAIPGRQTPSERWTRLPTSVVIA